LFLLSDWEKNLEMQDSFSCTPMLSVTAKEAGRVEDKVVYKLFELHLKEKKIIIVLCL